MTNVPSLYVRVYRGEANVYCLNPSSLTIREGISLSCVLLILDLLFPHYTWGYIVECVQVWTTWRVPSLYVRVYRNWAQMKGYLFRSLTIREGISPKRPPKPGHLKFPHYTWGYIGMPAFSSALPCVPSLYVRIYHSEPIRCRAFSGSLTIREGISWNMVILSNSEAFPHYAWGCITAEMPSILTMSVPLTMRECMLNSRYLIYRLFFCFSIHTKNIFKHIKYKQKAGGKRTRPVTGTDRMGKEKTVIS